MQTKPFLIAAMLMAFAMPAFAQAPQGTPTTIRGKITKVSEQAVIVKTREGPVVTIARAPNATVRVLTRKKLSDLKNGDYLASTSIPGKDGKLHAVEIHYLPPAAPELQTPYDLAPNSVMTNAHVTGIAKVTGGTTLSLTYKGASTAIVVDRKTVIVAPADGATTDLKPGKTVFVRATKGADGSLSSNSFTVEKNGVKPPM
jgi:hypothetical protein